MSKHQSIIDAVEAGDLRLARRLLDAELVPKGSRAFDDISGGIQSVFSAAGERCPALQVRHKAEVQRAAVGVDEFMTRYGIANKSSNRHLVISMVCRYTIDFIYRAPDDVDAKDHYKIPPYVRALHTLADVDKIVAAINNNFPGYLESGLVGIMGFSVLRTN